MFIGYNGFPRGVNDSPGRLNIQDVKNALTVHAELNAIFFSPVTPKRWTLYSTKHPCLHCAKAIIQSGMARVVCPSPDGHWVDEQREALHLFDEVGLQVQLLGVRDALGG